MEARFTGDHNQAAPPAASLATHSRAPKARKTCHTPGDAKLAQKDPTPRVKQLAWLLHFSSNAAGASGLQGLHGRHLLCARGG